MLHTIYVARALHTFPPLRLWLVGRGMPRLACAGSLLWKAAKLKYRGCMNRRHHHLDHAKPIAEGGQGRGMLAK
jgi:hypothetical protein